jgi:hypothetical protein
MAKDGSNPSNMGIVSQQDLRVICHNAGGTRTTSSGSQGSFNYDGSSCPLVASAAQLAMNISDWLFRTRL